MGKKPEPLLIRIVKVLDSVLASLCAVILGLMIAITLVAIFCRYVLSNALSWTEELTRYLMIVVGMFGPRLRLTDDHVGHCARRSAACMGAEGLPRHKLRPRRR